MLATSTRQPSRSNGGCSQRAVTESGPVDQPAAQLVVAQVELGQAAVRRTRPRSRRGGGGRRRTRPRPTPASAWAARNHSWRVADVVDGEVADDADAPVVARLHEAGEGVVAAEQRVDVVERVGVVAVARRRREERREVQPAHAERRRGGRGGPRCPAGRRRTPGARRGARRCRPGRPTPTRRPTPASAAGRRRRRRSGRGTPGRTIVSASHDGGGAWAERRKSAASATVRSCTPVPLTKR